MSTIIGISYEIMDEAKRNLSRAKSAAEEERISLNIAKITLEACGSRLKMSADDIGDQVSKVNTRLDNMDRISSSIDYAVRRFGEVDQACASRIKNIGLDFRRSVGLLNSREKFIADPLGSIVSEGEKAWKATTKVASDVGNTITKTANDAWNGAKDKVDYIGDVINRHKGSAATIGLEVAGIGFGIATIVGICGAAITIGPAILLGIAIAGVAYSLNTIVDSGTKIAQSEKSGESEEKSDGFNFIQDKLIKPVFHLNDADAKTWYDRSAFAVNTLNIGSGGYMAVKEAKVAGSIIKTSAKEVSHLEKISIKLTNKAAKATTIASKEGRLNKVLNVAEDIKKFKKDTSVAVVKKGIASVINIAGSGNTGASGIIEDTYSNIFKNNNRSILVN